MIFGTNTTSDISKLSQISLAKRLVKLRITILKYHSWYLCQISLQIMLLPIQILTHNAILMDTTSVEVPFFVQVINRKREVKVKQNYGDGGF